MPTWAPAASAAWRTRSRRGPRAGREDWQKILEGFEAGDSTATERIQEANNRKDELSKLLDLQRQTLHELSGRNRDEATKRLLGLSILSVARQSPRMWDVSFRNAGEMTAIHFQRFRGPCQHDESEHVAGAS